MNKISQKPIKPHRISWDVKFHEILLDFMRFHVIPSDFMRFHGISRIPCDSVRFLWGLEVSSISWQLSWVATILDYGVTSDHVTSQCIMGLADFLTHFQLTAILYPMAVTILDYDITSGQVTAQCIMGLAVTLDSVHHLDLPLVEWPTHLDLLLVPWRWRTSPSWILSAILDSYFWLVVILDPPFWIRIILEPPT